MALQLCKSSVISWVYWLFPLLSVLLDCTNIPSFFFRSVLLLSITKSVLRYSNEWALNNKTSLPYPKTWTLSYRLCSSLARHLVLKFKWDSPDDLSFHFTNTSSDWPSRTKMNSPLQEWYMNSCTPFLPLLLVMCPETNSQLIK